MTFSLGFLLGLMVGGTAGILSAALCFAARRSHDSHDIHGSHGSHGGSI